MPYTKNFRTPAELTGVARGAFDAIFDSFGIASLIPSSESFTLDYNFVIGAAPLPSAAKYRSFNTRSMVGKVGTGQAAQGKLPPTSIRLYVDEAQQLEMYGQTDAIGAKFDEYAENLATAIAFRTIIAAAEAIQDGTVTLNERGLDLTIDFQRNADLSADAGIAWGSLATAKPLDDLEALKAVFGKRISEIRISDLVMSQLQRNTSLIKAALRRGTDLPDRISQGDVVSTLADYGFRNLVVDEDVVVDTEGVEVPVFAENKVIFTSGSQVGSTQIGVTAEAMASDNGIDRNEAPGLFAGALPSEDPQGYDVLVAGIILPVLSAPNNTAVLTV
jgi:hypothetical protein